ncbi:DoxX family protein [Coraliomargarita akajimensis DSM 45221]|uniref:DoxX family protein n=2 Tax=Coraliomargarita TaxID=442430 RepID=D5EM73_CORAD|nr:DoxX family protein [Coraliomargarita akajimensis DSM 45221]
MVIRKQVAMGSLLVRLILAATFIAAALPKIAAPSAFADAIANYRVCPDQLVDWLAIILPWIELTIGLGLLVPWLQRSSGLIMTALLFLFISLHLSAWARGLDIECGCFGKEQENFEANYLWLLTRNSCLLACAVWLVIQDFRNKKARYGSTEPLNTSKPTDNS